MLQVDTLFSGDGILIKRYLANYEKPYCEKDFNIYPSISLAVGSCYRYKCQRHEFMLSSNEILVERGHLEFEVTKLPIWNQDTTLSLSFINQEHELCHAIAQFQQPAFVQKRSLAVDFISRRLLQGDKLSDLERKDLIVRFVSQLLFDYGKKKEEYTINFHNIRQIEDAKSYIYANYMNKIQIADIAQSAYISIFHFSRLFKKITGQSPYHFLLQVRLQEAKLLLQQGEIVTQAAISTGFESLEHFSHAFSRYYHMPPSVYRKVK